MTDVHRPAWLTDIRPNFLAPPEQQALYRSVAETDADALLAGGEVGEAPDAALYLSAIDNAARQPVYLVLAGSDVGHPLRP